MCKPPAAFPQPESACFRCAKALAAFLQPENRRLSAVRRLRKPPASAMRKRLPRFRSHRKPPAARFALPQSPPGFAYRAAYASLLYSSRLARQMPQRLCKRACPALRRLPGLSWEIVVDISLIRYYTENTIKMITRRVDACHSSLFVWLFIWRDAHMSKRKALQKRFCEWGL